MEQNLLETMLRHMGNKEMTGDSQHGFTKGKSCLTGVAAVYNRVTALVDKGRALMSSTWTSAKHLTLFPMTSLSLIWRHGFDRWTTWWIRNWVDGHTRGVAIHSLISKWRPVTSGDPQASILALALFNIFIGDMDNGIECTISKFVNDTKLCGAVNTLEGRDAIQMDFDRLDWWACVDLLKSSLAKLKVQNMDQGIPKHRYRLGREWTKSSPEEKDTWGCWLRRNPT